MKDHTHTNTHTKRPLINHYALHWISHVTLQFYILKDFFKLFIKFIFLKKDPQIATLTLRIFFKRDRISKAIIINIV